VLQKFGLPSARHLNAENGASSFQCFLASAIIADSNYPDRLVQACKWAIIANLLSDPIAEPIVAFLQIGMSEEELSKAFELAEDWLAKKVDFATDPKNKTLNLNWTTALRQATEIC
jgi:hypothetical protein